MSDPAFFRKDSAAIVAHNTQLADAQAELDRAFARWVELDAG
jgi:ATP-binding cassette subfamily F protein uup